MFIGLTCFTFILTLWEILLEMSYKRECCCISNSVLFVFICQVNLIFMPCAIIVCVYVHLDFSGHFCICLVVCVRVYMCLILIDDSGKKLENMHVCVCFPFLVGHAVSADSFSAYVNYGLIKWMLLILEKNFFSLLIRKNCLHWEIFGL